MQRILLIDENELILEGLKLHLSPRFVVITASDPYSALMEMGETKIDLILIDLIMPAISGFSLIASLRLQHPGTPIIAMSGWGKPVPPNALNVAKVLLKPFDLEELDRSLDEVLGC